MSKPDEIAVPRLREMVDAALAADPELSERALSIEITGKPDALRDIMRGKSRNPSAKTMMAIAARLGTTTDYLFRQVDDPAQVHSEVRLSDHRLDWRGPESGMPGIPLVGTGDCADLDVESDQGTVQVERSSFDPDHHVTYIARPPALRGDREAYAIYFHGTSMEPRFFAGEVGIAQPSRPAGPGDFVVVQLTNGEGPDVVTVLVKRLVRQAADYVELEQYNPPLTFRVPRQQVARLHRIVPQTELLFR
ncbi:MAG: S24 family peptidase [Novosphingobium sp.]